MKTIASRLSHEYKRLFKDGVCLPQDWRTLPTRSYIQVVRNHADMRDTCVAYSYWMHAAVLSVRRGSCQIALHSLLFVTHAYCILLYS